MDLPAARSRSSVDFSTNDAGPAPSVPVRIVDKAAARTDKSKALVLWSRTLELLNRGPGAQLYVDAGFKVNGVNLISRENIVGTVDMSPIDSPYPFALMLPQCP